jgi:hypothetical protein
MIKIDDPDEGAIFPLREAPDHVPHRGGSKALHKSTGFRWASSGVRGVRLETIRIGGTLCTSTRALQDFFDRLSTPRPAPGPSPRPSGRSRRVERALDRAGI